MELFIELCRNGKIEEAKQLYLLGDVNIHADNEDAFKWSCVKGHKEIAQWLYSLCPDIYTLEIEGSRIKSYKIYNIWDDIKVALDANDNNKIIEKLKITKTINAINEDCYICHEKSNIMSQLACNHIYCIQCIVEWAFSSNQKNECKCPYCTNKIVWNDVSLCKS